jgi:hypothetical protein
MKKGFNCPVAKTGVEDPEAASFLKKLMFQ